MKKTLIILAHPNMPESRLNKALIEAVRNESHVTVHNLYDSYKTAESIDVQKEQDLLLSHERIVFQFPLYWYSTPGLLKDWQDKVLVYGFAYGKQGDKLKDKIFKIAVTTGAPHYAFGAGGWNNFSIDELLRPVQQMATITQMIFTPTFCVSGALGISDEELKAKTEEFVSIIHTETWDDASTKFKKYVGA
jgi:glutathione-regulated potassium-efflux system ancillary protein KefG